MKALVKANQIQQQEEAAYTEEQWKKLDQTTKDQYLKDHPNSKYNPNKPAAPSPATSPAPKQKLTDDQKVERNYNKAIENINNLYPGLNTKQIELMNNEEMKYFKNAMLNELDGLGFVSPARDLFDKPASKITEQDYKNAGLDNEDQIKRFQKFKGIYDNARIINKIARDKIKKGTYYK